MNKNRTTIIRQHRLIINNKNEKKCQVDHIDRNRRNNRKSNLRLATNSENNMNRCKQSNNTSGFIGVHWDKNNKKWQVSIKINSKSIHLGRYENIEDAVKSRLMGELKYFGEEFAPQRHLFKEYGVS